MRVDNQTSDPVDFEQTGGSGLPEEDQAPGETKEKHKGKLSPKGQSGSSKTFTPVDKKPYKVVFKYPQDVRPPQKRAVARNIDDPNAEVNLCPGFVAKVNEKC